jgi:hypothetical protein
MVIVFAFQDRAQVAFAPADHYKVGFDPVCLIAADINADGKPDLICANYYGSSLSVLTNTGNGKFLLSSTILVASPSSVTAADVNGDGKIDLICANVGNDSITVLTNNGSGIFKFATSSSVGHRPQCIIATDVNNDGKPDLITANDYNSPDNPTYNPLTVLTNDGNGRFVLASVISNTAPYSVIAADINEDGYMDLISAGFGFVNVFTNNHNGGFILSQSPYLSGSPQKVVAADVNNDGHVDLVTANNVDSVSVLTNNGSGLFAVSSSVFVAGGPNSIAAMDVNGDGKVDIVTGTIYGSVYTDTAICVLTNDGNGGLVQASKLLIGGPSSEVIVDINGDGHLDLVAAGSAFSELLVFMQVPQLGISRLGNDCVVSWPTAWTNCELQETLNTDATDWNSSLGVLNNGTNYSLTIPSPVGNRFFRLRLP